MSGTLGNDADDLQFERFMCGLAITIALEGVPALYIHTLLATKNDADKVEHTGNFRSINRHIWDEDELVAKLSTGTHHQRVFEAATKLLSGVRVLIEPRAFLRFITSLTRYKLLIYLN